MGDVRFTFLGPPEVRHADQALLFSTRKEFALLIYLAVEGRVHSRKNLSELFWPEGDAMHGRAALRISLLHLRHLLGDGAGVEHVSHLVITRDTLSLDLTSDINIDLHIIYSAQLTYAGFPPLWQLTKRAMEVLCLGLLALGHVNLGEPQAGVNAGRDALDISLEICDYSHIFAVRLTHKIAVKRPLHAQNLQA
jgi:hypothetical protein